MKSVLGLLCVTALLIACDHKEIYDEAGSVETKDLLVPNGFDWELERDVDFNVTSKVETTVWVFDDAACQDLLAVLPVAVGENTYSLSIDKATDQLYVQYPTLDGKRGTIVVSVLNTKASTSSIGVVLPENGTGKEKHKGVIYYPKNEKWGSVFFEDMWPAMGDYDFNDVAVWYKIERNLDKGEIEVKIRLNAFGGVKPYQLGFQIDGLKVSQIAKVDDIDEDSDDDEGMFVLETKGDEVAVFIYDWPGKKGSRGGQYYNTEKAYRVDPDELEDNEVEIEIDLKNIRDIDNINLQSFNFFIRKTDGTEIHLKGYQPTEAFKAKYKEIVAASANLDQNSYYCTTNGFVWGLKVPKGIDHAIEGVDFTKAYKFFGEWVTSGGVNKKNWYNEEAGKEFRVDVGKDKDK